MVNFGVDRTLGVALPLSCRPSMAVLRSLSYGYYRFRADAKQQTRDHEARLRVIPPIASRL